MAKRRTRGPGKPIHERTAQLLDRYLLNLLRNGRAVRDPATGRAVVGEDGQPLRAELSAADLAVIRQRVRDVDTDQSLRGGRATNDLLMEAEKRGLRYPGPLRSAQVENAAAALRLKGTN